MDDDSDDDDDDGRESEAALSEGAWAEVEVAVEELVEAYPP